MISRHTTPPPDLDRNAGARSGASGIEPRSGLPVSDADAGTERAGERRDSHDEAVERGIATRYVVPNGVDRRDDG